MQDQLLTLLSSSQQPSSPGGGGGGGGGGTLGSHLGSSPPSIFTTRQTSLLPTLSRAHHLPTVSLMSVSFWVHFRVGGHLGINIDVATLQALRLAPSLCLVPPRWVCCPAMGRNLDFSPAPQPASPTGRRNLPCSVTNSLGLRSLLSDNLSLDTGDQKILHFRKIL